MKTHKHTDSHYEILGRLSTHELQAHNEYTSAVNLYRITVTLHRKVAVGENPVMTSELASQARCLAYNIATRALARAKARGLEYAGPIDDEKSTELVSFTSWFKDCHK